MAKATKKTGKRRRGSEKSTGKSGRNLRRLDEPMTEWRFEPVASIRTNLGILALWAGGVAAGMGAYGWHLHSQSPDAYGYSPYLVAGGIALIIVYLVVASKRARPLLVGDLGVGFERDGGRIERQPWCQLESLHEKGGALRLGFANNKRWALLLRQYPTGAKRLVAEAHARVVDRVELDSGLLDRLGTPASNEGQRLSPEPPQVTGARCMNTDKALSFERDVRMCARCGALYHREGVPTRCRSCDAPLRRKKSG